jgi:hypothetical protein
MMKALMLVLFAVLGIASAAAVEVAGVRFDDWVRIGNAELVANGAGLRKKVFFKVYAMVLYLPEKRSDAAGALDVKGPKRIAISLLRDLSAQQFVEAMQEGLAENLSAAEVAAIEDRLKQFSDVMLAIGEAKSGTRIEIDWLPEFGTHLAVDGQAQGTDIAGEDFYRALLKIWLGEKPVQDDLKQALLGKGA